MRAFLCILCALCAVFNVTMDNDVMIYLTGAVSPLRCHITSVIINKRVCMARRNCDL